MKTYKEFYVKLEPKTYMFYNETAKFLKRPIEDILSDTLYKYADIVARKAIENDKKEEL